MKKLILLALCLSACAENGGLMTVVDPTVKPAGEYCYVLGFTKTTVTLETTCDTEMCTIKLYSADVSVGFDQLEDITVCTEAQQDGAK